MPVGWEMSQYVDAVIIPVPAGNLDTYGEVAAEAGSVWLEHGALTYFEGMKDETMAEGGQGPGRSIDEAVGCTGEETSVVAFIGFESREHRDEVAATVMDDPVYRDHVGGELPFDPRRMASGSFRSIVHLEADR